MKKIKTMMEWVYSVRNVMYILGFVALLISVFVKGISAPIAFWPPDMIPHPHDPTQPSDERIISRYEKGNI